MRRFATAALLAVVGLISTESVEARTPRPKTQTSPVPPPPPHPLEPLTAWEHGLTYDLVRARFAADGHLPDDGLLFPYIALREPVKSEVLAWQPGRTYSRHAVIHVLHPSSNRLWVVDVDLHARSIARIDLTPAGTQAAVTAEEYVIADELVHAYEPWREAMLARGVNPDDVYVDVWAPGDQELPPSVVASLPHGAGTRLLRALAFLRGASVDDYDPEQPQNPYVRPVEGVVVTVDMNQREVVHMTDTVVRPVSSESGNAPGTRTGLEPMLVEQPQGAGFVVEGRRVRWQNWDFYVALHPRDGLVLYDVHYTDGPRRRSIAYRMSLSEIYVPYGMADENWSWRSAFDVGEYNLGTFAQTLEPLRDVPAHAHFFDAVFGSDVGPSEESPWGTWEAANTIAMYERDAGILWTRTDPSNAERDTRGRRELVVTWNAWIGNYIYGFDWVFAQDGSIKVEVALTGTTLNRGETDEERSEDEEAMAPIVGVDESGVLVAAPNHQHFFSFRLDMDIDGVANMVAETDLVHIPAAGFENGFGPRETAITSEGARDANPYTARTWEVRSAAHDHRPLGHPAYALEGSAIAFPLSSSDYAPLQRAAFATAPLWVTRQRDHELHAAGDFPNQGSGIAGLSAFVSPAERLDPVDGTDIVLWHTIGITHVPRPEDYPVMPTETIGFKLVPHAFFDRNPALDAQELPQARRRIRAARP